MHGRLERPARRDGIADHDCSRLARRGALWIGVGAISVDIYELVRGHEVEPLLLDAGLAALLEHRVEVGRRVDPLLHERANEVLPAGVLAKIFQEHEREAVVRPRRVQVGPVVHLGVGDAKVGLTVGRTEPIAFFAEDGLALVEPDRRPSSRVELDHVAKLVGEDPVHVRRAHARPERVEIDHLPLRRELVHPRGLLVSAAEVAGR